MSVVKNPLSSYGWPLPVHILGKTVYSDEVRSGSSLDLFCSDRCDKPVQFSLGPILMCEFILSQERMSLTFNTNVEPVQFWVWFVRIWVRFELSYFESRLGYGFAH